MTFIELFHLFLLLIVPGFLGALAYNIIAYWKTGVPITVALVIDIFTYLTMIIALFFIKDILTLSELMVYFDCLHFSMIYLPIVILLSIGYGIVFGLLRKLFFWIRRDRNA